MSHTGLEGVGYPSPVLLSAQVHSQRRDPSSLDRWGSHPRHYSSGSNWWVRSWSFTATSQYTEREHTVKKLPLKISDNKTHQAGKSGKTVPASWRQLLCRDSRKGIFYSFLMFRSRRYQDIGAFNLGYLRARTTGCTWCDLMRERSLILQHVAQWTTIRHKRALYLHCLFFIIWCKIIKITCNDCYRIKAEVMSFSVTCRFISTAFRTFVAVGSSVDRREKYICAGNYSVLLTPEWRSCLAPSAGKSLERLSSYFRCLRVSKLWWNLNANAIISVWLKAAVSVFCRLPILIHQYLKSLQQGDDRGVKKDVISSDEKEHRPNRDLL